MADLSGITTLTIKKEKRFAHGSVYVQPYFVLEGVTGPASTQEILQWLGDNGGGGSGIVVHGEYASDALAAAGGVSVGSYYELSSANIYGGIPGTIKKRKT